MRIYSFIIIIASIFLLSSCSKTERKKSERKTRRTSSNRERVAVQNADKNIVKMKESNGVFKIPVKINSSSMDFIFDTGASDITISEVEAIFLLKQGLLTEEDIIGVQNYQIADGSISEGTVINLKTVEIGNKTLYNIKASVIHNSSAPLLLGQSALAKFGNVSINFTNKEITFE